MSTVSGRLILEQLTFGNENLGVYVSSFKMTKLGFKTGKRTVWATKEKQNWYYLTPWLIWTLASQLSIRNWTCVQIRFLLKTMTGFNTFAFAREELRATIRMLRSICDEMYLIREQITSITG